MKIAIDIDGVLADFTGAVVKIANKHLGKDLPEGFQPNDWYWTEVLTKADWLALWLVIKDTKNFWETLQPLPGWWSLSHFWLPSLELYFVTKREETKGNPLLVQCNNWLRDYGLIKDHTSVIPVTSGTKGDIYKSLGIEFSLDDYQKNVVEAISREHTPYLLTREWNKDEPLLRVGSISRYLEIVEQELEGRVYGKDTT